MQGSIDKAEEVVARTGGAFMLQQFESAANPEIHYKTTGPEIWRDTAGTVDFLVAGAVGPVCGAGLRITHPRSTKPALWCLKLDLACLRAPSQSPACGPVRTDCLQGVRMQNRAWLCDRCWHRRHDHGGGRVPAGAEGRRAAHRG
jgi:hypothetical protein